MAGFGTLGADRGGSGCFAARGTAIPTSGSVLGVDYDLGDYAIFTGGGAGIFVAAFCGNGFGSGGWRDCGELLRVGHVGICGQRFHFGTAVCCRLCGSKCISVRQHYAGDCAGDPKGRPRVASGLSPVRGSVDRDCGGADSDGCMAGERLTMRRIPTAATLIV
jgi:hypothetical protein